jgi:hypothetical protein
MGKLVQGFFYFTPISLALQLPQASLYPSSHRDFSLFQQALIKKWCISGCIFGNVAAIAGAVLA